MKSINQVKDINSQIAFNAIDSKRAKARLEAIHYYYSSSFTLALESLARYYIANIRSYDSESWTCKQTGHLAVVNYVNSTINGMEFN